jgi:hypothetical protein
MSPKVEAVGKADHAPAVSSAPSNPSSSGATVRHPAPSLGPAVFEPALIFPTQPLELAALLRIWLGAALAIESGFPAAIASLTPGRDAGAVDALVPQHCTAGFRSSSGLVPVQDPSSWPREAAEGGGQREHRRSPTCAGRRYRGDHVRLMAALLRVIHCSKQSST